MPNSGSIPSPDYSADFNSKVEWIKSICKTEWRDSPVSEKERISLMMKAISPLDTALSQSLSFHSNSPSSISGPELTKLCVLFYIDELLKTFSASAIETNKSGLYVLFCQIYTWGKKLIESGSSMPPQILVQDFLAFEPQIVAFADLAEINHLPLATIVDRYQDSVLAKIRPSKSAD